MNIIWKFYVPMNILWKFVGVELIHPDLNPIFDINIIFIVNYFFSGRRCLRRQQGALSDRLCESQD
jgi:hypothetical protein